jgi:uncharacterized protein
MKVSDEVLLHGSIDDVWQAINDPAVLVRTIPGCELLEVTGPDRYRIVVSAGVAAIRGTYSGEVAMHDQQAPTSFVLTASGAGAPGTVRTDVAVTLSEDGSGRTRLTAGEFFAAVDDVLTGAMPISAEAASPGAEPAGRTFVAPGPSGRTPNGFVSGALVGGAIAIAGVLVGRLLGRRP